MALSCWKRLSVRGSTPVRWVAIALSGISWPFGPETWMSSSWLGREAAGALDLRDHLVAAAVHAEAVDEVAAQHRRDVARRAGPWSAPSTRPCSRSTTSSVSAWSMRTSTMGGKANCPLLAAAMHQLVGEADHLRVFGGRRDHQLDREQTGVGQRRRQEHRRADAGDAEQLAAFSSAWIGNTLRFRSRHDLSSMPPKPPVGKVIWKLCSNSGVLLKMRSTCAE